MNGRTHTYATDGCVVSVLLVSLWPTRFLEYGHNEVLVELILLYMANI